MTYSSPGVFVEEVPSAIRPISGVSTSTAAFVGVCADTVQLLARGDGVTDKTPTKFVDASVAKANTPVLCTSWNAFTQAFGDLIGASNATASAAKAPAIDAGQHALALGVYGFFNNGGSRAWVVRAATGADIPSTDIGPALAALEAIDEISIVAAPGLTANAQRAAVASHCSKMRDRFAVLDAPDGSKDLATLTLPSRNDYAAVYTPWIKAFDPAASLAGVSGGVAAVAPSGHIAGVYARVDAQRGVFKAPANETIAGALGLTTAISASDQDGLNPKGVNCIRTLNGSILIWGSRTVGGDDNTETKYVPVRRTLTFIEKSIRQGTQWVVFEPNTPALWQTLTRNVGAFLLGLWRQGALAGQTAKEAFYVKCDSDTNPTAQVANGQVTIEIGVAIARPAEFVVFRVSQWTGSAN